MSNKSQTEHLEQGVDIPYNQLNPDTLRNLIEEFVTREWSELSDAGYSLEDKIEQVFQQLKEKKAKLVFDLTSNTANIVVCR
ncbi:MAG: YheU family protein [Geobacteraceae bacterium]|nr:YheU family protein [Geobacteraceae bacterium]